MIVSSDTHVAAVDAPEAEAVVGVAPFDARVRHVELARAVAALTHTHEGELIVEGFDGLDLVA